MFPKEQPNCESHVFGEAKKSLVCLYYRAWSLGNQFFFSASSAIPLVSLALFSPDISLLNSLESQCFWAFFTWNLHYLLVIIISKSFFMFQLISLFYFLYISIVASGYLWLRHGVFGEARNNNQSLQIKRCIVLVKKEDFIERLLETGCHSVLLDL